MNRVMSRVVNIAALVPPVLLAMGLLGGCPIYGDQDRHRICNTNGCFDCPTDTLTDACTAWECTTSWDCPAGRQCNRFRRCAAIADTTDGGGQCKAPSECTGGLTCGGDNLCHAENCSVVSCPTGFRCELKGGQAQCTATTDGGTSSTDGGPSARACSSNADCPTLGEKCINAQCTAAAKQCSNSTHCVAGSQCVEGTCTPSCSTSKPCPTGYACDEARGVCSANSAPTACASSGQCSGGNVCVTGHCVTPCTDAGVCGAGQLCVAGGCIPDQRATFTCNESGTLAEGVQDKCNAGSICLRRSCYIACDPNVDGGSICKSADTFNQCKSVSVASASFSICSSATGLGTECSPTVPCTAGRICVDGLCR